MSSQKGNSQKSGPPKHKNNRVFKNNLHDTSKQTKIINSLDMPGLCVHCKSILEWKVKYKKYKMITQPRKCVKCDCKTVARSYYTVCMPCIDAQGICGKCAQKAETVLPIATKTQEEINQEFEASLKHLREREKRTLLRLAGGGKGGKTGGDDDEDQTTQAERSLAVKEAYLAARTDGAPQSSDEDGDDSCDLSDDD